MKSRVIASKGPDEGVHLPPPAPIGSIRTRIFWGSDLNLETCGISARSMLQKRP